jgi:hypothetical protein
MRTVLSIDHYARHITDPADKASFFATAPIATGAAYWDAADSLHKPNASCGEVGDALQQLDVELAVRAGDSRKFQIERQATQQVLVKTVELSLQ